MLTIYSSLYYCKYALYLYLYLYLHLGNGDIWEKSSYDYHYNNYLI